MNAACVTCGAAQRAAQRGGELTHQLLAYARRQNISPRPVDLAAMIGGMGDLLQRSLGGLVRVETTLDADLWPAFCDPTQLELMLLNLAINARDAMPAGGVISIAAHNVPATGEAAAGTRRRRLCFDRGYRFRHRHVAGNP